MEGDPIECDWRRKVQHKRGTYIDELEPLSDRKIHDGNVETVEFSRSPLLLAELKAFLNRETDNN